MDEVVVDEVVVDEVVVDEVVVDEVVVVEVAAEVVEDGVAVLEVRMVDIMVEEDIGTTTGRIANITMVPPIIGGITLLTLIPMITPIMKTQFMVMIAVKNAPKDIKDVLRAERPKKDVLTNCKGVFQRVDFKN